MYLKTAIRLDVPLAINDREAMVEAHGGTGEDADEATALCAELRTIVGVPPGSYTPQQRETARLALLYAEQYLDGYLDAINGSCRLEEKQARKRRTQIRRVRFTHFGETYIEAATKNARAVDAMDYMQKIPNKVPHGN